MKHLCDKIIQHRSTVVVVHAGLGNLLPPLIENDCSVVAIHENQELSEKAHVEVTNFNSFQGDKLKTYFEVAFHPQLSHNSPLYGFGHHWLTIGRQTDAPSTPVETEHMQEDQDEKDAQNETQVSAKPGESHIDVISNILLMESLTVVVRSGAAKPLTVTSPSKVILAPKTSGSNEIFCANSECRASINADEAIECPTCEMQYCKDCCNTTARGSDILHCTKSCARSAVRA